MCTLCRVVRPSRFHQSTKRHRKALFPAAKAGKPERRRYVPRDWDAEAHRAAIIEEFGEVEDLVDPGTDTYVEFA